MEQATEWFIAITMLIVGLSHLLRPSDWAEVFRLLSEFGRPGAFINGGLALAPGATFVACHRSCEWPGVLLTGFGWLLVVKGAICLIAPDRALQSMKFSSENPKSFVGGGMVALAIGAWACFCLWHRTQGL